MKKIMESNYGDKVWCDWTCGEDYTVSKEEGGLLFGSKAVCPKCAPKCEASATKYNEERYIKERCPAGISFANWVRGVLRGGEPGKTTMYEL